MPVALLAFTDRGFALAQTLADALHGQAERCAPDGGLSRWTQAHFERENALIYVGAVGIAVRAIAPHCRHKSCDPAVVVVDELGRFAIPILSGHLGGANALARQIGCIIGALPVITTATDINGVFAVDVWAKAQHCRIENPAQIKRVSAALLAGESVGIWSRWPISGAVPEGVIPTDRAHCSVLLDVGSHTDAPENTLHLVPRIGVLGVGCRRNTSRQALEEAFERWQVERGVCPQCISAAATIDLKRDEQGLLDFCAGHGWKLTFASAAQLSTVPGDFKTSPFVQKITGVDNVCERAAVLESGGTLYARKWAENGVTFALALKPYAPNWSDSNE